MTDLVCGVVHGVPTGDAGRHTKEMATIRKLILHMCYKNKCLNMCRPCGIADVYTLTQPIPTVQSAGLY